MVDDRSNCLLNYDSGESMMEANKASIGCGKDYVGILQHIICLDYADANESITLFMCQWKKQTDNYNHNTYVCDKHGFLSMNFKHYTPQFI